MFVSAEQKIQALHRSGYRCQGRAPHGGYCNTRTATVVIIDGRPTVRCKLHTAEAGHTSPSDGVDSTRQGSSSSVEDEPPPLSSPY